MVDGPHESGAAPSERIEVAEGEWKHSASAILFTTNIQSGIGVSFYSPKDKLAMLGHFDDIAFERGYFDIQRATVQLANDETLEARNRVQAAMKRWIGRGAALKTLWLDQSRNTINEYSLDARTGYDKAVIGAE